MNGRRHSSAAGRFAGAAIVAAIAFVGIAQPALGASPDFGTPTGVSTFGQGIVFKQPYSGPAYASAQVVLTFPGAIAPVTIDLQSQGATTLQYTVDASKGQLLPNMKIVAQFGVVFSDGTTEIGPALTVIYADTRFQWKKVTAGLVNIYYYSGDSSFGQQLGTIAQQGMAKTTSLLGATETKPIDFYVYGDQSSFLDAMGPSTTGDVGGQAKPEFRTCYALIEPTNVAYAADAIPHELTHVVFADVTDNPYHAPLNWFNEGMAVYLSVGFGSDDRSRIAQAVQAGTLMPLSALTGAFPRITARFYLAYAEAVSAVDFMVRTYGQSDVAKLLSAYGTGATDDEAFQSAMGVDTSAFDKAWLASNGVNSSQSFGPQPAPTGPVPPGWGSSASGAVPTPSPSEVAIVTTPAPGGSGQPAGDTANPNATLEALGVAGIYSAIALVLLITGVIIRRRSQGGAP
jgi:hypothetical protein